jgi:two-component system, OmpR family, sensor kinase
MKSIRHTLLLWLSVGLTLGIGLAAVVLYSRAQQESNEIFDYQMQQLAASLPTQPFSPMPGRQRGPDAARDIVIQIWDGNGLRIYHSHEQLPLPERAELGFATVQTPHGPWRVYSAQQGGTVVQVAQPMSARQAIAAGTALRTVAPLLLLFPFVGGLLWITVSQGLSPVRRVAREVETRDAATLAPIPDADLPQEIRPLTQALNDLLARVDHAIGAQRAFIADAAHELRTPLTALKLQIELARRAGDEAERQLAFAELEQGFERAMRLVQQLLTLARQEPAASPHRRESVDLAPLAQDVVSSLASIAYDKRIDLGISQADAIPVTGDPDALRVMLENVVENAIRYTPENGSIDVSVQRSGAGATVSIDDSGPGIPPAELERVFDRFYRVPGTVAPGSGLGLAIVREIADAHQARVTLTNTGHGLRVDIALPERRAEQAEPSELKATVDTQ